MRAVAYSIRSFEKEPLAKANRKKHEITLISNALCMETVQYASGKDVVILSADDYLPEAIIKKLASMGVKYVALRATDTSNIDKHAAERYGLSVAAVNQSSPAPSTGPEFIVHHYEIASTTINNLDTWSDGKHADKDVAGLIA